ncbi:MAG: AIR synthase-related protein [Flavobacteriaceae bacterium]|nr:AIR synthase-related protein [Flavobacteriaceae bacterium]
MSTLNKKAAETMLRFKAHACTDITGFGLLGHLAEMLRNTEVSAELEMDSIPIIREVRNLAAAGTIPGGTYNNLEFVNDEVSFHGLSKINQLLLADAQTSGGLLISFSPEDAAGFVELFNVESEIKASSSLAGSSQNKDALIQCEVNPC